MSDEVFGVRRRIFSIPCPHFERTYIKLFSEEFNIKTRNLTQSFQRLLLTRLESFHICDYFCSLLFIVRFAVMFGEGLSAPHPAVVPNFSDKFEVGVVRSLSLLFVKSAVEFRTDFNLYLFVYGVFVFLGLKLASSTYLSSR